VWVFVKKVFERSDTSSKTASGVISRRFRNPNICRVMVISTLLLLKDLLLEDPLFAQWKRLQDLVNV
jgi:hypothetical protein